MNVSVKCQNMMAFWVNSLVGWELHNGLRGKLKPGKLRNKVYELSRQVGKEKSMQRQHRVTEDALKSLKMALSISVENYTQLKEKGALEKHFEYIQESITLNQSIDQLVKSLEVHMGRISAEKEIIDSREQTIKTDNQPDL